METSTQEEVTLIEPEIKRGLAEVKLSWLAGFIDGEGHFFIQKNRSENGGFRYYPRLCATNTDKYTLDCIRLTYGGSVLGTVNKPHVGHKRAYRWWLSGEKAGDLAQKLLNYMVTKKAQCRLFVKFCRYRNQKYPNLLTMYRMKLRMTALNRRGT